MPRRSVLLLFVPIALALVGLGALFGMSEWRMWRRHDAPLVPLVAPAPADPVAGEHMARVVGCWAGCHGNVGEGGADVVTGISRVTAPTLSQVMPHYSDAELARLVRYGVKRDRRSAVGMRAGVLWPLGDQDLANIIAHLRRQPWLPPVARDRDLTLLGRLGLITGAWKVSADQVDRSAPRWGELPRTTPFERGRYLASIVCSECHGLDFRGDPIERGPSLAIVAAYGPQQFRRLFRTARSLDGRLIERMDWMPDVGFTDQEIGDIYLFLRSYHGLE
jgi:cytochrome c553